MSGVAEVIALIGSYGLAGWLVVGVATLMLMNLVRGIIYYNPLAPPHIPSPIPWLGNIVAFGERPVDFLLESLEKYGPCYSFTMFGTEVTYVLGSEASANFWNSHNDHLNAEDLYKNITVPVFGKGVAFDVPNKVFSQQKQLAKDGLTLKRFEVYTQMVEEECLKYIADHFDDEGEMNFHEAMAQMIVFTATRCLHGIESREAFSSEEVAKLYSDLDGGFSPQAWFLPPWLPLPSFRARDRAHTEIKRQFNTIVENRRKAEASGEGKETADLLHTFMTKSYTAPVNGGRKLNNDEVSGLLIALLMAGQHTSSTTSSWAGFFICREGLQDQLLEEQIKARGPLGSNTPTITTDDLDQMPLLHSVVRETLRLRPPIMQMMRMVRKELTVEATVDGKKRKYVIPPGNQVCVSPSVNGRNPSEWKDADKFVADRFVGPDGKVGDVPYPASHHDPEEDKPYKWVPFGAGRHRCIGFKFAQLQIRCVWSTLLRNFEFELPGGKFPATNFRTMIHTPLVPTIKYKRRPGSQTARK